MIRYDTVLPARRLVTAGREQAGCAGIRPGPAGGRTGNGSGEDAGR